MGHFPESRELLVWKHSECVNCEFSLTCPKHVANLRMCFDEDGLDKSRTTNALIKRTIRFICKAQKNARRFKQDADRKSKRWGWSEPEPRSMVAVMNCSSIEEFVACQKSG